MDTGLQEEPNQAKGKGKNSFPWLGLLLMHPTSVFLFWEWNPKTGVEPFEVGKLMKQELFGFMESSLLGEKVL